MAAKANCKGWITSSAPSRLSWARAGASGNRACQAIDSWQTEGAAPSPNPGLDLCRSSKRTWTSRPISLSSRRRA